VAQPRPSLYPTRSSAGALLGQQLASRGYQSCILLGITPEGVEIAAHAAKAMGAQFDVIVASFIKLGANLAPVGAMAESAPAEMDPDFQPGMNLLEKLQAAIDESRARVRQDLVLYRTQRPVKKLEGRTAVIVEGQIVYPWKVLAAAKAAEGLGAREVVIAAPVATQAAADRIRASTRELFLQTPHGMDRINLTLSGGVAVYPSDGESEEDLLEKAGLALRKARAVAVLWPGALVLAADTIVVVDGRALGKPADAAEARAMLRTLRGRAHEVMTGVVVLDAATGRHAAETVVSRVTMAGYSDAAIDAYVAGGEPLDKAGAYAIQGEGGALVAGLEGSRSNVVGLPLPTTAALLRRFGVAVSAPPPAA